MMTSFSALLAFCEGNSPVTGEFPSQRPVTQSFDIFFDVRFRLNKRLNKPSRRRWFETPLWRHCNVTWCPGNCSKQAKVCHVVKMEWVEYQARDQVIHFLSLEGQNATYIDHLLPNEYLSSALCYTIVTSWVHEFRRGKEDVKHDHRPQEMSRKSTRLWLKIKKIDIESSSVNRLVNGYRSFNLTRNLSISNVCARWVPRTLPPEITKT